MKAAVSLLVFSAGAYCAGASFGSLEFKFSLGGGLFGGEVVEHEEELSKYFIWVTADSAGQPLDTSAVRLKHTSFGPETQVSFYVHKNFSIGANYQNDGVYQRIKGYEDEQDRSDLINIHRLGPNITLWTPLLLERWRLSAGLQGGYAFGYITRIAHVAEHIRLTSPLRDQVLEDNKKSSLTGWAFGIRANAVYYVAAPFYIGAMGRLNVDRIEIAGGAEELYAGRSVNTSYMLGFVLGVHTKPAG